MSKPITQLSVLIFSTVLLGGCAVMTAGVERGDERNFVRSINDVNADRVIEARLSRAYDYKLSGVAVDVAEGVVLLTGTVPRKEDRIEAERIAWSAPDVMQIGNEIMVSSKQGLLGNTRDEILETSVRARLTADKYVKGRNYNVETHDGTVYLLGVARNPRELDRAARIAALTRGTEEVISYVRVHNDGEIPAPAHAAAQAPAQRALPDHLTTEPLPFENGMDRPAPMRLAPMSEPIPYSQPRAPEALGQSAVPSIPPSNPQTAPYYIDPETGQQIRVKTKTED